MFDNGALVTAGTVEIQDPTEPLGKRAFTLTGSDDSAGELLWDAAAVGRLTQSVGQDNATALRRIKADPAVREAVRKRLKFGMTVVTTDEPADAKTRTAEGFVVLDAES